MHGNLASTHELSPSAAHSALRIEINTFQTTAEWQPCQVGPYLCLRVWNLSQAPSNNWPRLRRCSLHSPSTEQAVPAPAGDLELRAECTLHPCIATNEKPWALPMLHTVWGGIYPGLNVGAERAVTSISNSLGSKFCSSGMMSSSTFQSSKDPSGRNLRMVIGIFRWRSSFSAI